MSFMMSHGGYVKVFTDGACPSNGRSGAQAGFGVFWGDDHPLNVSAPVNGGRATNNSGEIQAATCAMQIAKENGIRKLEINTDSRFLIDAVTKWMQGWKQNGWRLASGHPVKNERDFKQLDYAMRYLQVRWQFVPAHHGIYGNEMADQLAREGAMMYNG
ncbi:hypothetical protein PYW08_014196 [Mythimna loreyi]|uniref:Uncharacterized protein n=1 Tax=Mythimna loreyi TaxID=667449 RepID=A0ACC2R8Y2_9NEOP|nr:hypothetical protein PYW08_014196 [Mythimna loreyi]